VRSNGLRRVRPGVRHRLFAHRPLPHARDKRVGRLHSPRPGERRRQTARAARQPALVCAGRIRRVLGDLLRLLALSGKAAAVFEAVTLLPCAAVKPARLTHARPARALTKVESGKPFERCKLPFLTHLWIREPLSNSFPELESGSLPRRPATDRLGIP